MKHVEKLSGWYCNECFTELTNEEHHYYDDRCEQCERKRLARIEYWRHGGWDRELDELYGETMPRLN